MLPGSIEWITSVHPSSPNAHSIAVAAASVAAEIDSSVNERLEETYHPNIRLIRGLEKPVIAAVNGPCAGAGLSLLHKDRVDEARTALISAEERVRARADWFQGRELVEAQIEREFGRRLPLTVLFQAPTLEELVVAMEERNR